MTVEVKDSFEIKHDAPGSSHSAGVVAVFKPVRGKPIPDIGVAVELHRPNADVIDVTVDEIKDHGPLKSFFFRGLTKDAVPVGSILKWSNDKTRWRRQAQRTASA